ncbi:MAG: methionine--tRNA ligase [Bacteroidetes bacterium GWC2_33_15]|nr:MAG: methionine--tRNA ligase [Bacteroidetes bacterium GWA2_33_15]OFX50768.1 MAG: methionine--tRNA ligase [Bacteroidetes bacterium GWC2_33_15]OFX62949.1 MAG: methionine--tRNA ligase [Bacteroidetes bacterium GWB2_32_14]OFX70018.1 MAG: methionine--tRNA ligase [Bacteroidetes bacterium GWD2_33_33]HAN19017.1 methionine--tRNA ligase [Bacteroidales bacterium]
MKKPKRYLITSALPYANGPLHLGHIAGAYLPADIYVRYLKLKGEDVVFICGSDEHGVPITLRARKEGVSPQDIVDKYHEMIKKSFSELGIAFDIYHRTSDPLHHETASDFFKKMYEKGEFIEKEEEQFFDEQEQQFLADRYIIGTCPKCGFENAYGDQCEKCGTSLSPKELINPKSTISGNPPVLKTTKHWYLDLEKYQHEWLEKWIDSHKSDWKANVYGQCKSWLNSGLQPRAVTRDLDWGVPVPVPDSQGKVLYVWFDAPIGYISATKAWAKEHGKNWKDYWQSDDSRLIHFIGKDNIVFHCLIFPAMLKAHGDYILPDNVPANEFLNLEGDKLSTSRNWAVWIHEYLNDFPGKQDVLRYAICTTLPEQKDNDFTWKDFQTRNNSELVAIFGNFVNRTIVLTHKYFGGKVPACEALTDFDKQTLAEIDVIKENLEKSIENFRFREAIKTAMDLARLGNKYLADTEPWKVIKTDEERVKTILNISLQITANLSIIMEPFIPFTAEKLRRFLNIEKLNWALAGNADLLKTGHQIAQAELLFDKIEDEEIEKQIQKLMDSKKANEIANVKVDPAKGNITYDDFSKMDIRVGTILEAERVPKTDKLLKLKIDTGIDVRTVVSGIAIDHKPENIVGKQVSILVNLEPRTIKGIESKGMILMAEDAGGKLNFVIPGEKTSNGSGIK